MKNAENKQATGTQEETAMEISTRYVERHWNHNAAAMIPACWVARVEAGQHKGLEARWYDRKGAIEALKDELKG